MEQGADKAREGCPEAKGGYEVVRAARPQPPMVPTFFAQHAVAQDELSHKSLFLQQLAQGPAGVSCQALRGQVQPAPRQLVQSLQDSLLGLGPTLLAQPAVGAPDFLHVPGVPAGLPQHAPRARPHRVAASDAGSRSWGKGTAGPAAGLLSCWQ